jgi:acetyltransferase-like isoleucine patch superfamily enzyme
VRLLKIVNSIYLLIYFFLFGGLKYGLKSGVKIGDGCRIYTRNWGTEPFLISIGNRVTITSGVKFLTHDGSTWLCRNDNGNRYQKYAPIIIGDNVFIGVNSIIMPGVNIGNNVVVGAGSVITKDLPSNGVYVGTPAKFVTSFIDYENKIKLTCVNDEDLAFYNTSYKKKVLKAVELQNAKV